MRRLYIHVHHHRWFYTALIVAALVWLFSGVFLPTLRLFAAGDAFYLSYLILTVWLVVGMSPTEIRRRAEIDDEGMVFIAITTVVAVGFSLVSIFELLNQTDKPDVVRLVLSIGSAPLAWSVLHTVAAVHYAHMYYSDSDPGPGRADVGGLSFPDSNEPTVWDFLYYSFVIGMTAQVSDVQVTNTTMRKITLVHSVVSFFLNTVLIALAVNVAVAMAQASH